MSDHKQQIKRDWSSAPYYELAENNLRPFWSENSPFLRMFNSLNLLNVIELACGHGRHPEYIRANYAFCHITLVDINPPNIDFCRKRFEGDDRFSYLINSGSDFRPLASRAYTSLFCYDAMVHFEYDDVFSYLKEIYRILTPNGRAVLHHSNYDKVRARVIPIIRVGETSCLRHCLLMRPCAAAFWWRSRKSLTGERGLDWIA